VQGMQYQNNILQP